MKPSNVLCAKSQDDVVHLEAIGSVEIRMIGASLNMSAQPDDARLNSVDFVLPVGKEGIVALAVRADWERRSLCTPWLLRMSWRESKAYIDLESPWISPGDHLLGQAYERCLEVRVGDRVYSSSEDRAKAKGFRCIPDPNLLCRCLVEDDVGPEELEAAAVEYEKNLSACEQLDQAHEELESLRTHFDDVVKERNEAKKGWRDALSREKVLCRQLSAASRLCEVARPKRFQGNAFRKASEEFRQDAV